MIHSEPFFSMAAQDMQRSRAERRVAGHLRDMHVRAKAIAASTTSDGLFYRSIQYACAGGLIIVPSLAQEAPMAADPVRAMTMALASLPGSASGGAGIDAVETRGRASRILAARKLGQMRAFWGERFDGVMRCVEAERSR